MRLLLAEDEVELANALSAVLKHKNYSVDAVYNGIDAYNYAIAQDYDGIILDIMMPGMDGIQVLTKMEEEKPALTMADFNISDAVYDAASPFTTLAETKGKKLTIDVANGLSYHGDEGAIRQLVSILTENAVKYADEDGEIIVKLFTSHGGKETDLEVSNTCKEPPQGDLTKLFDRFYRDDSSRTRSKGEKKGGYGIGLSIAQAIVRSHKSKISCKAENGMMIFTAQLK